MNDFDDLMKTIKKNYRRKNEYVPPNPIIVVNPWRDDHCCHCHWCNCRKWVQVVPTWPKILYQKSINNFTL